MREELLLRALSGVAEEYVMEAAPDAAGRREETRPRRAKRIPLRWLAAAAVLIALLTQTTLGAAAAEQVREAVTDLLQALFPPREIVVTVEGESEALSHLAGGQLPESAAAGEPAVPGFAVYYDTGRYTMTEENGVTYLRPIPVLPTRQEVRDQNAALLEGLTDAEAEAEIDRILAEREAFYAALPACELEIRHLAEVAPETAAQAAQEELTADGMTVTEPERCTQPEGLSLTASAGDSWDSAQAAVWLVGDGSGGTFRLTARYYLEAAEGHGARFAAMVQTFAVVAP